MQKKSEKSNGGNYETDGLTDILIQAMALTLWW